MTLDPEVRTTNEIESAPERLQRLDHEECWEVIDRHELGRVGLVESGLPVVLPINFVRDGKSLVMHVRPGSSVALASDGRHAVMEVDEIDEVSEVGTSVVAHGRLRDVVHDDERDRLTQLPLRPWAGGDRPVIVRLDVAEVTGRTVKLPPIVSDGVVADGG